MDFRRETLGSLAAAVRTRKVAARELVSHALERIEALDEQVNAFVAVDGDAALTDAAVLDEAIARGEDPGPLAGIPLAVKDLEDAAGFRTTRGSAVLADDEPAAADSVLVGRLKEAGCIVVGKTNTPELGWKAETANPTFGATLNPWRLTHSPGGSSGGSAAAIAAGMVPLATGSDGGGSIRIPSAACGLSGLKPSLGRVPTGGPNPPDYHHLSTRGPMARTMPDVVLALDSVIGPDPSDLRSLPMPEPTWTGALENAHLPRRVAWSPTLGYATADREVLDICESAVRGLERLGAEVVPVDTVFAEDPLGAWLTLANTYNLRTCERYRGTELWDRLDPELAASMEEAMGVSGVELVKADDECHRLNLRLVEVFREVRLLVTLTTAAAAPRSGQRGVVNGETVFDWVRFTHPFNMTRSPVATVCVGTTAEGLPVALQLVGPQHGDLVVLRAAAALEAGLDLRLVAPLG